jgi:tight adherence protein C
MEFLDSLPSVAITPSTLIVIGIGLGALLMVLGAASALSGQDPVLRRMSAQRKSGPGVADRALLRTQSKAPTGLMAALIPADRKERTDVEKKLAVAGISGVHAVRNYYLTRAVIGLLLPAGLLAVISMWRIGAIPLPVRIEGLLAELTPLKTFQAACILVTAGFFGPALWLRQKAEERRRAIEESFPNALDLVQISVEAGLGFDAAMVRVGNELELVAPALSAEFLNAQREIQAGRSRDKALLDMASRTGVEEVTSFANVVLQSMRYGTSISDTLTTYAREMRRAREIRAQEKANRLPVQMSAVMASLMLPALLMLTLGPVVLRYVNYATGS